MRPNHLAAAAAAALTVLACVGAAAQSDALEHFEKRVRPVLAQHCFACHSAEAPSVFAGLRLDSRAGILRGGDSGPAAVPGSSGESLMVRALRGAAKTPMPPTGRLAEDQIAAVEEWIDAGAPWPGGPSAGLPDPGEEFDLERRRSEHWAWQPVGRPEPPAVRDEAWPASEIDRFVLARLEAAGLSPAPPAGRRTLLRRLSFALTGLPPTARELHEFVSDRSPRALEAVVERLLSSPHFGERWARHWMDLFRYTESHGSEGDPDLPEAWRYRDYLIRAFNDDVPYDQLVREHLAGDLLPRPRYNRALGLNESLLGTANLRMIEHGFQPVDPWEDRVKWTDNQIDVFSKALQGLTVSCARCHDHKFDAISQRDYYALFGVLKSARPVQRAVDAPRLLNRNKQALRGKKRQIREELARLWLLAADDLPARLLRGGEAVVAAVESAACEPDSALYPWAELGSRARRGLESGWGALVSWRAQQRRSREAFNREQFGYIWRPADSLAGWKWIGTGLEGASGPGEFSILPAGDRVIEGVYGPGAFSGLLSRRHNGVLQTPRFTVDSDRISFQVQGSGFSFVRLIVENYAVPRGGIYWQRYSPKRDEPVWTGWDTTYWKGFSAYVEFATMQDSTNFALDREHSRQKPRPKPKGDGRSHFGALAVAFHDEDVQPKAVDAAADHLLAGPAPGSRHELARRYADRLRVAVAAWRAGSPSAAEAAFLDEFVRLGLVPTAVSSSHALDRLVAEYRELEGDVPVYRRAPGVLDEQGPPQPLLIRGSHADLGDPVPQRYLTALGGELYDDPAVARLRLAEEVADPANPLTARVMVNRVWSHLFGQGIVRTVDNFGRVGSPPTHPELLDFLAAGFIEDGWSVKRLIQRLVLTSVYQQSSEASAAASEVDPGNALLQHMPVRRLEAEAVRDSLLAVSGRLDPSVLGPSVNVYYAFAKGKTKGDRVKGPLDGDGRRSVYQEIRRNAHNPFLEVFDQPKPSSTRGRRDATNVPAQALTMLNSPLVAAQASLWGARLANRPGPDSGTVRHVFLTALGRPPDPVELDASLGYLGPDPDAAVWADFAHSVFNLKEFLYVR